MPSVIGGYWSAPRVEKRASDWPEAIPRVLTRIRFCEHPSVLWLLGFSSWKLLAQMHAAGSSWRVLFSVVFPLRFLILLCVRSLTPTYNASTAVCLLISSFCARLPKSISQHADLVKWNVVGFFLKSKTTFLHSRQTFYGRWAYSWMGKGKEEGVEKGGRRGEKVFFFKESSCALPLFYLHVANTALLHITNNQHMPINWDWTQPNSEFKTKGK